MAPIFAHNAVVLMQETPSLCLVIGEGEDRTLCYTLSNVGALPGTSLHNCRQRCTRSTLIMCMPTLTLNLVIAFDAKLRPSPDSRLIHARAIALPLQWSSCECQRW